MYKSLDRSHLDYCDTIYHIPALNSQSNLCVALNSVVEKVDRTQYQAALAITGTRQGSNRSTLYEERVWEPLSVRRWCSRILQVNKIKKTTRLLPTSEINNLQTADVYIDVITLILFKK